MDYVEWVHTPSPVPSQSPSLCEKRQQGLIPDLEPASAMMFEPKLGGAIEHDITPEPGSETYLPYYQ